MHDHKYKTLLSNTFLISLGTFGSKLLTFVMVRFYTGVLTPADYGTADLIMQTANLLLPLVSLGITNGVFRFALDRKEQRRSIFTIGFYTILVGSLILLAALPLLSNSESLREYTLLIGVYTLASCLHSLCAQYIRAEGKTALFAVQGIINTALVIGFNITFLLVFRMGVFGYVMSVVAADGICTLFLVLREKLWKLWLPKPERQLWNAMLRYSIPLIPATIFWWITSVSDRYMVAYFLGTDANGLYAVACKIPTVLTLLSTIFMEAWQFSAIQEATGDREVHIRFYTQVWSAFLAVMVMAGSVIIVLCRLEIRMLSTQQYYEAWKYIPTLSMAMVFSAFSSFMGSVYVVTVFDNGQTAWDALRDRVCKGNRIGAAMSVAAVGAVSLGLYFLTGPLGGLFVPVQDAPAVVPQAVAFMRRMAPFFLFYALAESFSGACCGTGDTVRPMILTLLSICLLRVLGILLLLPRQHTMECIIDIYIASWIAAGIGFLSLWQWEKKRVQKA